MKRSKESSGRRTTRDPLEHRIESALLPGHFIRYRDSFNFVRALRDMAQQIDPLIEEEPARAANLYEVFLAGCYAKVEELDDSGGELGRFMQKLCCRWVRARQSGTFPAENTAETLLHWIDADAYGYTSGLEHDLAEVLDDEGRRALALAAQVRFSDASKEAERRRGELGGEGSKRHWADVLRAVYAAQRNLFSYIRLCREMGMRGEDCLVIADLFEANGAMNQALSWIRRGLESEGMNGLASYDLRRRELALLAGLDRRKEALELAWKDFVARPSVITYEEIIRYAPEEERSGWRERALTRAEREDLDAAVELYLETGETKRLAVLIQRTNDEDLREMSRYTLKHVATQLMRLRPDVAARLFCLAGLLSVEEGKSKYYSTAVANLKRAKKCYEQADMVDAWNRIADDIRERHGRKTAFIPKFETMLQGAPEEKKTSFLETAEKRWQRQTPRQ